MKEPGPNIKGARVICWSPLDERHETTGSCHHTIDGETRSPYAGVAIGQHLGDSMVYLYYCDADWNPLTDTYHSNIGRAKEEAELEFRGVGKTWTDIG